MFVPCGKDGETEGPNLEFDGVDNVGKSSNLRDVGDCSGNPVLRGKAFGATGGCCIPRSAFGPLGASFVGSAFSFLVPSGISSFKFADRGRSEETLDVLTAPNSGT